MSALWRSKGCPMPAADLAEKGYFFAVGDRLFPTPDFIKWLVKNDGIRGNNDNIKGFNQNHYP
jgi:hypothetical protein